MNWRRSIRGLALLVGAGCGAGESVEGFSLSDSASVTIASNGVEGLWPRDSVWRLREDYRIASSDDDPYYQWGWIGGVAINSRHELHLLDLPAQQVQVYDSTGRWQRSLGGPGGGPGELGASNSNTSTVLITREDTVLVVDMGNLRINAYSPTGVPIRSHPLSLAPGTPYRFGLRSGRTLLELTQPIIFSDTAAVPPSVLITIDSAGAVADTLFSVPDMPPLDLRGGAGGIPLRILAPELWWDASPDGRIAIGHSARYEIRIHGADGALERIVRRELPVRVVTAEERQWLRVPMERALARQLAGADSVGAVVLRQVQENLSVAEQWPFFRQVAFGPMGRLLVGRFAPLRDPDGPREPASSPWDVFDREGRFLGILELPPGLRLLTATDEEIIAIGADQAGGEVLVRLVP